jgi:branched-chain amino acid transport system substrate-binding protein
LGGGMLLKRQRPLLFFLFFILIFVSCEKKEILIGFSGQLTGINSDLGIHARNGAVLAVEEINSTGGVYQKKIKLIIKDDEGTPQKAKQADMELIEEKVVAIIGHMTSSQTMAALPVIEKSDIILLSPTASSPKFSDKKDKFFRVQGSSEFSARALGKFASQNFKLKNLLIIKQQGNNDFTAPYEKHFLKGFQNNDILLHKVFISGQIEEIREKIPKILSEKNYDAILLIASSRVCAAVIQISSHTKIKPIMFTSSWSATESLIRHGGRFVEETYLAKTGFTDKEKKDYKKFVETYMNRFGYKPSFAAEQGYNCIKILEQALKKTKGKKQGLEKALTKIKNFNTFQGQLTINKFGDAVMPVSILKIKNSQFEKILEINPEKEKAK